MDRKQWRYIIIRLLHKLLLKGELISWMKEEIIGCEDENYDSYKISWLIDPDLGRKPRKFHVFTSISLTKSQPAASLAAIIPFVSLSPIPNLSTLVSIYISIYISIYLI